METRKEFNIRAELKKMQQRIDRRRAGLSAEVPFDLYAQLQERINLRRAGIPVDRVDKIAPFSIPTKK